MDKPLVVFDCEVYPNYFLIAFKNIKNDKVLTFDVLGENETLTQNQISKINQIFKQRTIFGYNSRNYDIPITFFALEGKTCSQIYDLSSLIINENLKGWQVIKKFGLFDSYKADHFDIQEPAPAVRISLKLYGARLNSFRLQDLPYDPTKVLDKEQASNVKDYCINDLNTTIDLYNAIKPRLDLRKELSKEYGLDVRSKSDAQISEVVIKNKLSRINSNIRFKAPTFNQNRIIKYQSPSYIKFHSEQLKQVNNYLNNQEFTIQKSGSVYCPKKLKDLKIKLGNSIYQLGIGGLHSCERSQTIIPGKNELLIDKDVTSYYPSIILNLGLFPKNLGPNFLKVYRDIVNERLEAKKNKDKVKNESLKIVINGTFGKLGSKWSYLYDPELLLNVTLTGQLSLLMLIDSLEYNGINVVSANTDGFVSYFDKSKETIYQKLCKDWSIETKFNLEQTNYKALYMRDVNNYFALTIDNEEKRKGIFTIDGLTKNPQAPICYDAVTSFLKNGTPIQETIENCKELEKFLHVRTVKGGGVWKDQYLGKVVRWYYSNQGDTIKYFENGNKVAKSDNSKPAMQLSDFPKDLDFDRYNNESLEILYDLGIL